MLWAAAAHPPGTHANPAGARPKKSPGKSFASCQTCLCRKERSGKNSQAGRRDGSAGTAWGCCRQGKPHAHPIFHPYPISRDVLDGTPVPQFTLLQAGTQGKPAALSPSSGRGDAWPHPARARQGPGLWEPVGGSRLHCSLTPSTRVRADTAPLRGTLWWPQPARRSQAPAWGALH